MEHPPPFPKAIVKLLALGLISAILLCVGCGATGGAASITCSYTLDGAAVAAFPPAGYPSAWSDTKQAFSITLTDRTTGITSSLIVPSCKRAEARRIIAERLADDRSEATQGVPIADRTYK